MSEPSTAANLLFLREEELRLGLELFFVAGRDFAGAADPLLAEQGLERVHHRVIHFVASRRQLTVTALSDYLGLSKQSLGRALERLTAEGYVLYKVGPSDRRQRLLSLTPKGQELEKRLSDRFRARMAKAYREAGGQAVEGFRRVLIGLVDAPADRRAFERPVGG
jgi:DNA-binding MarR family transcriptional regulator